MLKDAKENNDSNEVAYLLKDGKVTKVYGDQDSVSFAPGEKATELLFNSKPNSIVMLHNHPGQSSFSLTDLYLFIFNNSIKTLTIVTNKGLRQKNIANQLVLIVLKNIIKIRI